MQTIKVKNPFIEEIKLHAINSWSKFTDWAYYNSVKSMYEFAENIGAETNDNSVPPKSDLEAAFIILPIEWQMGMFLKFFDDEGMVISWGFDTGPKRFTWKINKVNKQPESVIISMKQFDTRPEAIKDSFIEAFKEMEKWKQE